MNFPIPIRMPSRLVLLISAAILLQANSGRTAELVVDAQTQARDLLSGTVGGRAKTFDASHAIPADGHPTSKLDPQEQARRLILGKSNFGGIAGSTAAIDAETKVTRAMAARDERRGYGYLDAQESAQRMILGNRAW